MARSGRPGLAAPHPDGALASAASAGVAIEAKAGVANARSHITQDMVSRRRILGAAAPPPGALAFSGLPAEAYRGKVAWPKFRRVSISPTRIEAAATEARPAAWRRSVQDPIYSLIVFAAMCGSASLGFFIHSRLSEKHRTPE